MALDGTYSGLQASVADWLNRDDLTSQIADFIAMATDRLSLDLRVAEMETTETNAFTDGVVTLPTDCIELRQVLAGSPLRPLTRVGLDFVAENYPANYASTPIYYTVTGSTITTYPSASDQDVQIVCYSKIPALSDASPTNWLLTKLPKIYLYAALIESAPFLGDDNRLQVWGTFYNQAKDALTKQDFGARYYGMSTRVRGVTP